jgi:hypothetical protein
MDLDKQMAAAAPSPGPAAYSFGSLRAGHLFLSLDSNRLTHAQTAEGSESVMVVVNEQRKVKLSGIFLNLPTSGEAMSTPKNMSHAFH